MTALTFRAWYRHVMTSGGVNKRWRIPMGLTKGQCKVDNPEKLATNTRRNKTKTQCNMCWTPLCANKHKKST
jgi:hypothetical protein